MCRIPVEVTQNKPGDDWLTVINRDKNVFHHQADMFIVSEQKKTPINFFHIDIAPYALEVDDISLIKLIIHSHKIRIN